MELTDRRFVAQQYGTGTNLRARASLHERYSTNPYGWFNWVWDQLDLAPGSRVLELGCGDGQLWRARAGRLPAGCSLTLTDLSMGMLTAARATALAPGATWAAVDAQALPFRNASYDVVIANHLLYHVPDRARALREIRRVLVPGGRLCATTVGQDHMRELHRWLARVSPAAASAAGARMPDFTLQSGASELAAPFEHVSSARYDDALLVTAVEPVIAYALSMWADYLGPEALSALEGILQHTLNAEGGIRIQKESGMLCAC